ncbi:MAG: hypothetical protein B7C55_05630 [Actinomycetales bacterium mxb001]|nr:MAG: hypothetical protein B7C55_05630 [Actinomycetales bacterium mxb001]
MTTVNVLGHLSVVADDERALVLAPQSRRLLALLASSPGQSLDREFLAEGLWGAADTAHLRSLQVHISHLRSALGREVIESGDQGYCLMIEGEAIDEVRFRSLIADGQEALVHAHYDDAITLLAEGLDLWRGEPYADLTCDAISARRAGLRELRFSAEDAHLRARVEMVRNPSDAESVIPLCAHRLAEQPFRESRVILQMRCLMAAGRLTDAVNVAADFRRHVLARVGIEPGPEFAEVAARIMRRDPALMPAAWRSRVDVPAYLTPLVQRDGEHELAVALLKWNSVRLLCVTGEPGVGKTRVAAAVAETIGHGFPGGVTWLGQEQVSDPDRALACIAQTLDLTGPPSDLRQRVPAVLGRRRTLVVLDGVEGEAVKRCVAVLLSSGPLVSVLTTGVQRLGLASEHELHLRPLSTEASEDLVRELVRTMGGFSDHVDTEALTEARGLPLALEHLAIDLLSGGVRA